MLVSAGSLSQRLLENSLGGKIFRIGWRSVGWGRRLIGLNHASIVDCDTGLSHPNAITATAKTIHEL